ncbi:hypothetical protein MM326_18345 [Alkalihalobacillus sp. LMS6]|uniref:hypothetical protein n=1 Tax=Alkalihalobacillus sp. LMS6 TaxID=2924034 RepID=UPI0020D0E21F|nr:hypothetical protein [Alkalihalobacillus sp. LMS6]UTR06014.1 hypothetical protein MM326_18345 [Alkalihalobacillus sp. LMS6]
MKKTWLVALCSTTVLLAACTDGEDENTEENANGNGETEETTDQASEDDELTAEDILQEAIALYDGLEGLYMETVGEGDIDFSIDEEDIEDEIDEEANSTELGLEMNIRQWTFVDGDDFYDRSEQEMIMNMETDSDASTEETVSYSFTDYSDPAYAIMYDEGDDEAIRIERDLDFDFSHMAQRYEDLLDNADELTLVGEEEVNGYQTYHVEAEMDGETMAFYFDQDTYFSVRDEIIGGDDDMDTTLDGGFQAEDDVIDYELNPEFDESLFQAPDDMDVTDGEISDTIG